MSTLLIMLPVAPVFYATKCPFQALLFGCLALLLGMGTDDRNLARTRTLGLAAIAALVAWLLPCHNCRPESGLHPLDHILWAEGAALFCLLVAMLGVGLRRLGLNPVA